MIKRFLRKSKNLTKEFGILGLFRIYGRGVMWYILPRSAKVKVKVNGYYMYIDPKDLGISKALFIYGTREKDQVNIVKNNLPAGAKVLDIGANIGYYVILESNIIGSRGKVIAYEPSSENCSLLKKNVRLNNLDDRVEINNVAVSNKTGMSTFYLLDKSNIHTLSPNNYKEGSKVNSIGKEDVATVDIHEIVDKNRDIKFIRMDIEGHEVEVLEGLTRAVRDFNIYPDILFETHFIKYDSTKHDMEGKLKDLFDLGYFPKAFVSNNIQIPELIERGYEPEIIYTDRTSRGIFKGISKEDALYFICNERGSRAVLLKKG